MLRKAECLWIGLPLSLLVACAAAATPIPAVDGTNTRVSIDGNQFDIHGGSLSSDQTNLFHSFQEFGLSQNQVANFLSNAQIENILTRITGGNPSLVDGLLQVSGGSSNLFLMNPSGIIFGPNASLNLPASFTATTANGIGFDNLWFNATGDNTYSNLVGTPDAFAFTVSEPGVIVNSGDLAVSSGNQLVLTAGTIDSTGQLSAPDGQIHVSTIPGDSVVRISQPGHLLQLEITPSDLAGNTPEAWTLPILSLPELLASQNFSEFQADSIDTEPTHNTSITPGDLAVRELSAQAAYLSADQTLQLTESQLQVDGDLTLIGNETVRVRDSVERAVQIYAGGDLRIQGNEGIDILALNHLQAAVQSGSDLSLISNGIISGDTHFRSNRSFSILNSSGEAGDFLSLYDPIISATGNVTFGDYTGAALKVETLGSITAGDIRITQPDTLLAVGTDPDIAILTSSPALILRAGLTELQNPVNAPLTIDGTTFNSAGNAAQGTVQVNNINTSNFQDNAGPVIISATGDISTGNIATNSGGGTGSTFTIEASETATSRRRSIRFSGRTSTTNTGAGGNIELTSAEGSIRVNGQLLSFANSTANSGAVVLNALQNIQVNDISSSGVVNNGGTISLLSQQGSIQTGTIASNSSDGNGGNINLVAPNGSIQTADIQSVSRNSSGGTIGLSASGNITTDNLSSGLFQSFGGEGGVIAARSESGDVTTGILYSEGDTRGGEISLAAENLIKTEEIFTSPGGTVDLSGAAFDLGTISSDFFDLELAGLNLTIEVSQAPAGVVTQNVESIREPNEVELIEQERQIEFDRYFGFGADFTRKFVSSEHIGVALREIEADTKKSAAVVYVVANEEEVYLQVETADDEGLARLAANVENRDQLLEAVDRLNQVLQDPDADYIDAAADVYDMLIRPIKGSVASDSILLFSMDSGLRLLPIAALYDRQQEKFFADQYSFSIIPNFTSTDIRYSDLRQAEVLAMGASQFPDTSYSDLLAVPVELAAIANPNKVLLNENFTLQNLKDSRRQRPFQILHLATHANFLPGEPNNSSIQLWQDELRLDPTQLKLLEWDSPPIDLLVLSSCRTALGNREAELGFAGLALQSGVKSALASLWYVSDAGSLVMMYEFYKQLGVISPSGLPPISKVTKAEALSNAQQNIRDTSKVRQSLEELLSILSNQKNTSPVLQNLGEEDLQRLEQGLQGLIDQIDNQDQSPFEHPFYWAPFTMIGSPW